MLPALAVAEALDGARRARDVRRVAGSRRSAVWFLKPASSSTPSGSAGFPRQAVAWRSLRALVLARRRTARVPARSCGAGDPTSSSAAAATSPGRWCFAAATMRIPAALTEADAHLGLANRLAAPFAKRLFLAYPLEGHDGDEGRASSAGRSRARSRPHPAGRGARDLRAARGRAGARRRSARSRARAALNEFVVETWGASGPADPAHHRAAATTSSCGARVQRDDYRVDRRDRPVRRGALGRRPRARALRARPSGRSPRPGGLRSSCRIRSRPATTRPRTPSTSSAPAARSWCASSSSTTCPSSSARCSTTPARLAADGRGDARAPRGRTPPRRSPTS